MNDDIREIERLTQECIKAKNYIVELSETLTKQATEIERLKAELSEAVKLLTDVRDNTKHKDQP